MMNYDQMVRLKTMLHAMRAAGAKEAAERREHA